MADDNAASGERFAPDSACVSINSSSLDKSVIVVRRGHLVFEKYYESDDQVRDETGRANFEGVAFSAERSHELRSVSKSIASLLYGIALRQRMMPPLDQPLLPHFPRYSDLWVNGRSRSRSLGIDWNADLPYDDPRNGTDGDGGSC